MSKKTAIKKQASRDKKIECAFCHGSGIQPRTVASRCSACGGKGKLVFNNPIISCPSCQGKGTAGTSLLACINCRGIGVVEQEESIREVEEEPLKEPLKKITKLGKYLLELRREQGVSIRHAARQCEIAPSYMAKIEAGDTYKTIGLDTIVKLSKFYGIPVSAMLKEAGFIESYESDLPELAQYLRVKYQLSPQAVRDMEMAKEIVDKKYKR